MNLRDKMKQRVAAPSKVMAAPDSTESLKSDSAAGLGTGVNRSESTGAAANPSPDKGQDTSALVSASPAPASTEAPTSAAQTGLKRPPVDLTKALARAKVLSTAAMAAPKPEPTPVKGKGSLPTPKQSPLMERMRKIKESGEELKSVFPQELPEEVHFEGFNVEQHLDDLKAIEHSLITDVPGLPMLMGRVMRNLHQYEELAHILSEEQIQVVVAAFAKRKGIEIVAPTKSTGSVKGRSIVNATKDLTVSQIMDML